jgi:hypothetical protein
MGREAVYMGMNTSYSILARAFVVIVIRKGVVEE